MRQYRDLQAVYGSYDCGMNLASHISAEVARCRADVNLTLAELRKIDPTAPKVDV